MATEDHPRSRGVYRTVWVYNARSQVEDHPRSRGVYDDDASWVRSTAGSSPLARGLLTASPSGGIEGRIIPARAGFTSGCWWGASQWSGSSPLARGLRNRRPELILSSWIIPARAGFTNPLEKERDRC